MYRSTKIREERAALFREKLGGKCVRCGEDFPQALVFHHIDPATKSFGLNKPNLTRAFEDVEAEVAKCELLCLNCHSKEHWG